MSADNHRIIGSLDSADQMTLYNAYTELRENDEIVQRAKNLSLYAAGRLLQTWYALQMKMPVGDLCLNYKPENWDRCVGNTQIAIQGGELYMLREALTGSDNSSDKEFQMSLDGAGAAILPTGLCFRLIKRPDDCNDGPATALILSYKSNNPY